MLLFLKSLYFTFAGADWPQSHAVENRSRTISVWNNTALRWARNVGEQQKCQDRVRLAQDRVERRIGRENRWQMHWPEHTMG